MSKTLDLSDEKNWLSLKKDLKKTVGESAYNNWIKHLSFVSHENSTLSFSLPTKAYISYNFDIILSSFNSIIYYLTNFNPNH